MDWAVRWEKKGQFTQLLEFRYHNTMIEMPNGSHILFDKIAKDDTWKGATLVVPFKLK